MSRAKIFYFLGELKFYFVSVKNIYSYDRKYFSCILGYRVRNNNGRATTPDTKVSWLEYVQITHTFKMTESLD